MRSDALGSIFLFLVSVCILSTTARNFMNNELKKYGDMEISLSRLASNVQPTEQLEPATNSRMGDMPIPRRPPGFSIGPSDAGILFVYLGNITKK
jgi:hypothetical protein